MLLASMLGSPQGGSGVSSSALQRQIAHATCAYGFHCQFKDNFMVVPTKQCECGNRFHTQCLSLSFQDAETQVDSHVNMDQSGFLFASARQAKCGSGRRSGRGAACCRGMVSVLVSRFDETQRRHDCFRSKMFTHTGKAEINQFTTDPIYNKMNLSQPK